MISAQYIPLSVRVKNWSLSLFSKEDMASLISDDANTATARIISKEGLSLTSGTASMGLIKNLKDRLVHYGIIASSTLSGEGRSFVRELMREFEVENLKNLVRMIISGRFEDTFYSFAFSSELPLQKYREIRSFSELRKFLSTSFYKGILSSLDKVEQEKNSVYWESALDTLYANRIFVVSKRLDPKGRLGARKIILYPIHLKRLLLVYRYRFNYGVDPSNVFSQIPNATHICSMEIWKSFVSAPTGSAFFSLLKEKNYIHENTVEDAAEIYRSISRKIYTLCRRELYGSLASITAFLAFYQLKKIQIDQLSTILEAKTLFIQKDDVLAYL
ncbi:MAG: V0D/AC39 family V-type ATPase subunit [Brevinema sp.]